MTRMKIVINMNLSPLWVKALEDAGYLVVSAIEQFEKYLKQGALVTLDKNRGRVRIIPIIRKEQWKKLN
jgi:hypothetical protein